MGVIRSWTQAGSSNTMKGSLRPSSCQGAGYAIVATTRLSVLMLRQPQRRTRSTLGTAAVPPLPRCPVRQGPTHWDTLALPLRALLYVRAQDVPTVAKCYPWTFATKLELAVKLVRWLCVWLGGMDKQVRLVVDGGYAKRPFLKPVMALGVVVFSRLRKDAALRTVPSSRSTRAAADLRQGTDRLGQACRAQAWLATGDVPAIRPACGQDHQNI